MLTAAEQQAVDQLAACRPTDVAEARAILAGCRPRGRAGVAAVARDEAGPRALRSLLQDHLAAVTPGFLSPAEARDIAGRIAAYEAAAGGTDRHLRTVGKAWFACCGGDEDEYFQDSDTANDDVERVAPGLVDRILAWCRAVVDAPVAVREGWAGPGFVMFTSRLVEGVAGDVHMDWEGLAADQGAAIETECYSCVTMIQKPVFGGGLRIWDLAYGVTQDASPKIDGDRVASVDINYRVGDLVALDAHDLHQIQAPSGSTDRITLTFHLARLADGWRVWL